MNNDIVITTRTISPEEMEAIMPTLQQFDIEAAEKAAAKTANKKKWFKVAAIAATVIEVAAVVAYFIW